MISAKKIIEALRLVPHPEGGYYRETYRSGDTIPVDALAKDYDGARQVSTAIYYLLEAGDFSAMHRVATDEIFHFYLGDAVEIFTIDPAGKGAVRHLGQDLEAGQVPQYLVPRGHWQGLRVAEGGRFALLGATVAPGFDFRDFEMGDRDGLVDQFPTWAGMVRELTR